MEDIDKKKPKVSVCVITYNQEKYIRECLQSIVDQQTDFDFEVIVGDDCSTDGTRAIVQEFANRYPSTVVPIFYSQKVGGTQNYISVHNLAKGDYVAHIDGDDLALAGKLQSQANYLDSDSNCSVVWHRMYVFDDAGTFCRPNLADLTMFNNDRVSLQDVLKFGSVGYHSSLMYRATSRKTRQTGNEVLDYFYTVELLMSGYGKYLNDTLGKYRYNKGMGISRKDNGPTVVKRVYVEHLKYFLAEFPKFRKEVFTNSLLYLLVEIKNHRMSTFIFLKLALKSFCLINIREFIKDVDRFRRINAGF